MCPDKDKETGMYAFNFNIEEVQGVNPGDEKTQDIAWCGAVEEPEWLQVQHQDSYTGGYLIVEKEDGDEPKENYQNRYEVLYDSDEDNEWGDDDMEFMIPEKWTKKAPTKGRRAPKTTETAFNVEVKGKDEETVNACSHKNDWREEWLLDSGSTVNLTNNKARFWKQCTTSTTVTVGDGSQVEGLLNGSIILKEKNSQKNLKISATYCPDFRKNILSVKRLQQAGFMVMFDDEKATVQDKKTKVIAFTCDKGSDGMFYLRGTREGDRQDAEASFLAGDEPEVWKDVEVEIDEDEYQCGTPLLDSQGQEFVAQNGKAS
jgi:hypothetical protein